MWAPAAPASSLRGVSRSLAEALGPQGLGSTADAVTSPRGRNGPGKGTGGPSGEDGDGVRLSVNITVPLSGHHLSWVHLPAFAPTDPQHRDAPRPARGLQHRAPASEPRQESEHGRPAPGPLPALPHLGGRGVQQLHQRGADGRKLSPAGRSCRLSRETLPGGGSRPGTLCTLLGVLSLLMTVPAPRTFAAPGGSCPHPNTRCALDSLAPIKSLERVDQKLKVVPTTPPPTSCPLLLPTELTQPGLQFGKHSACQAWLGPGNMRW